MLDPTNEVAQRIATRNLYATGTQCHPLIHFYKRVHTVQNSPPSILAQRVMRRMMMINALQYNYYLLQIYCIRSNLSDKFRQPDARTRQRIGEWSALGGVHSEPPPSCHQREEFVAAATISMFFFSLEILLVCSWKARASGLIILKAGIYCCCRHRTYIESLLFHRACALFPRPSSECL